MKLSQKNKFLQFLFFATQNWDIFVYQKFRYKTPQNSIRIVHFLTHKT